MLRDRARASNPIPSGALPSNTRREVLLLLKKRGGLTAEQAGEALSITAVGARAHLAALEREGVVQCLRQRQRVGRPVHVYRLTERAQEFFPHSYRELATDILEALESQFGEDAVVQLFQRRTEREEAVYRERLEGKGFEERVRELAAVLDEHGYLTELQQEEDGSYLIVEQNCAIEGVARRFGHACLSELDLLRELLPEAEVTRQQHVLGGDLHCAYRITLRDRQARAHSAAAGA